MSLFDEVNLAEITHPDYPGERLVACRNPALAAERARKRDELLAATEAELAPIRRRARPPAPAGPDKIALRVGKVINRHKVAKHFELASPTTTSATPARPTTSPPRRPSTAST